MSNYSFEAQDSVRVRLQLTTDILVRPALRQRSTLGEREEPLEQLQIILVTIFLCICIVCLLSSAVRYFTKLLIPA